MLTQRFGKQYISKAKTFSSPVTHRDLNEHITPNNRRQRRTPVGVGVIETSPFPVV